MAATKEQRALLSTRGAENPLLLKHEVMKSATVLMSSGNVFPLENTKKSHITAAVLHLVMKVERCW